VDFTAADRKLNAWLAVTQPILADKTRQHQLPGVEFINLSGGSLELCLGNDDLRSPV
jgi:hypothetical protein